jgi:ATP-dependent DNA ligase
MEALSNVGATVVVSPSSDDRVDRFDHFAQTQRYFPLREGPDLILESVRTVPTGPLWAYEIKHDGYRFFCRRDGDRCASFPGAAMTGATITD